MKTLKICLFLFLLPLSFYANEAHDIIAKLDKNLRGDFMYAQMKMIVSNKRGSRTVKLESWSKGTSRSFMKILYPKKDRGITFLKRDKQMWQYIPKIERTIKIPASMMLQSWMGSDFSNDDMVKESSFVDDYHAKVLFKRGKIATIELLPKRHAPVVWGKVIIEIDIVNAVPRKETFYDDRMKKVRVMTFSRVQKHGSHKIPMVMELKPLGKNKSKNKTKVIFEKINYDTPIDSSYFSKNALKRYSR